MREKIQKGNLVHGERFKDLYDLKSLYIISSEPITCEFEVYKKLNLKNKTNLLEDIKTLRKKYPRSLS